MPKHHRITKTEVSQPASLCLGVAHNNVLHGIGTQVIICYPLELLQRHRLNTRCVTGLEVIRVSEVADFLYDTQFRAQGFIFQSLAP